MFYYTIISIKIIIGYCLLWCKAAMKPSRFWKELFYTTKGSTNHIIPLHLSTILTIVSIGPGFIKVNNCPILLTVLHHSTKVVTSIIHSLISIKYNINTYHNKNYGDSLETHSFSKMWKVDVWPRKMLSSFNTTSNLVSVIRSLAW